VRAVAPVPCLLSLLNAESRKRTVSDLGGESDNGGSTTSSRKVAKSEPTIAVWKIPSDALFQYTHSSPNLAPAALRRPHSNG
jgi:hypothetical protein